MTHRLRTLLAAVAALALLPAAGNPPPPEAERVVPGVRAGFVADGAGGCWVWAGGFRRGITGLTATWSGPCPDGPAEGEGRAVTTWQDGGREKQMVWEGPLRRGKAEGRGRLDHVDNGEVIAREEGAFAEDFLVEGRVELPRAGMVYEGRMRRSHPQGPGKLTTPGRTFEGTWENGCLRTKEGWVSFTRPPEDCEGAPT